jgi:hypothetical protein
MLIRLDLGGWTLIRAGVGDFMGVNLGLAKKSKGHRKCNFGRHA